ncbi:MAG: hypothetical protein Q4B26_15480 [Eubacteriales bacterium]|nr:hypothetical protein [Eubacteriales bacterium]
MMRFNFGFEEKAIIYMFGCSDKRRTIGNIQGVDSIRAPWADGWDIGVSNILKVFLDPEVTQEEYQEYYQQVKNKVEFEVFRQKEIYISQVGTSVPVSDDFWKDYLKSVIIGYFCKSDLDEAFHNVRLLQCYTENVAVQDVLEDVVATLEDINTFDAWKFEDYQKQYRELAMVGNVKYQIDYQSFIAYIWEVQDVELE